MRWACDPVTQYPPPCCFEFASPLNSMVRTWICEAVTYGLGKPSVPCLRPIVLDTIPTVARGRGAW